MSPRILLSLVSFLLTFLTAWAAPAANKPQAIATAPPIAAPAFLDVVTFEVRTDGETHPLIVTTGPSLMRVDQPSDRLSLIYNSQTDFYTGLEHSNYTYWEFSWPEVREKVESSQRYEARLRDLTSEGLGISQPSMATNGTPTTNAPDASTASAGSDNSGYVWRLTNDKKKIAGFDCVRWTGDTISGENVEAWCVAGPVPKMQAAMERLRTINEPIALVPVRTLVPPFVFLVYDALVKGGVTPILIKWGGDQDKSSFAYIEAKTREGKLSFFTVPKTYMKTTLVTMDGVLNPIREKNGIK